ncbi:uncharacterized protein LOC111591837 [Ceratitis capitata]|uniref:uncharacterized protein LOC111591837 n=1 Tax=Ceratitis capitata TaxID=7213 RepID=UPI000C6C4441|nr:uncharacterized protein LOC111591837 [Ceratitis capitata]
MDVPVKLDSRTDVKSKEINVVKLQNDPRAQQFSKQLLDLGDVFPDIINNYLNQYWLRNRAILAASIDATVGEEEAVKTHQEGNHTIFLKIGSQIILLRNLNPPKLCNEKFKGETDLLPRIPMIPFHLKGYNFPFVKLSRCL